MYAVIGRGFLSLTFAASLYEAVGVPVARLPLSADDQRVLSKSTTSLVCDGLSADSKRGRNQLRACNASTRLKYALVQVRSGDVSSYSIVPLASRVLLANSRVVAVVVGCAN
jgi:hypothetical protein